MTRKPQTRPKLTDAERHKRFVAMVREVGASDDPKDFDKAFNTVIKVDLKKTLKPVPKGSGP
jgi:hypothetical protein